jgi:PKD repeat protein
MTTSNNFMRYGTGNCFWTATDLYSRYLLNTSAQVYRWNTPLKSYGLSLRCVMDYPFTAATTVLPQVQGSVTRWGDYDSDGDMDLYLSGTTAYPNGICDIYRNNGNGTFTALGAAFERISGSADWGDFDCDGDLDLLIAGYSFSATEYITRLYRNDGAGVFTNYPIDVPGAYQVKWGDYDSDGDPDILLNQADLVNQDNGKIEIYENKGTGTYQRTGIYFEKVATDFVSLTLASFDWGDYNNDGFLDVVVSGEDDISNKYCKIYKNNGNKTFTDLDLLIRGARDGRVSWGDFDNDNDLDILLTGYYDDLQVFKYEGNDVFSSVPTNMADGQHFSSWVDFNNDGNLDVLIAGYNGTNAYSGNGDGVFEYKPFSATKVSHPDIDIADYDNDNDLDFVYSGWANAAYTRIYSNNTKVVNHTPPIPTGLTARQNGADVVFSWNPATDYENEKNLSYNITAGTSSGNCIIISPLSDLSSGKRLKLNQGNVGYDTAWVLKNAPLGTLYWSVQSIDKTLKSSGFANFRSFEVKPPFSGITIGTELTNVTVTGTSFIDMNNDGLLDILVSGSNTLGMIPSQEVFCFINQGNNTFVPGTISGSRLVGKFIPCNLNGDTYMDALLYGDDYIPTGVGHFYNRVQKIYGLINNTSGGFTVSTGDFADIEPYAKTPGDFDNDGDEDIFIIGYKNDTSGTYLFRKENTGYAVQDLGLKFDVTDMAISACDVDNDLDMDIAYGPYILINDDGFIQTAVFPFKSVYAMDWGDFDGDGDMDVALSGTDTIDNYTTRIFENKGNMSFSPLKVNIKAFSGKSFLRWLDFNNDGLLDLVASGMRDGYHAYIYLNQGNGSFEETDYPDYDAQDRGDFDDDGDLDMLGSYMVYISNGDWINDPPDAPSGLTYALDEFDVVLSWDRAADIQNSNGLSYNVKVGSTEGSWDVMQVLTSEEGDLRVPRLGNVQANTSWRLKNLPLGDYYWSVQAVDQGFKGGAWAPEQKFTVSYVSANFAADTVCEGNTTQFQDLSVAAAEGNVNAWDWDFGDGHSSNLRNPTHLYDHGGNYEVILTAHSGIYQHSKTQTIFVKHKPHPGFTAPTVCERNKTLFTNTSDTSSMSVASWLWSFGDGDFSNVQGSVEHPYLEPRNYMAKLRITATNGCADSLINQVIIGKYPNVTISLVDQDETVELCNGDSSTLGVEYISGYDYQWKKDGLNLTNKNLSYLVIKNRGNYSVVITNPQGNCKDTSAVIPVSMRETPPKVTITADSDTNICQGGSVYFNVPFNADYFYQWNYNGIPILNATSNGLYAEKEGSYAVDVSNGGCNTLSYPKQVVYKSGLPKPTLTARGPNVWYFICSIEHAKLYRWYYNGNLVAENDKNLFYAGTNLGEYYVVVNDGGECYVPSDKVVIPVVYTGAEQTEAESDFYLYPNPTNGNIRIFYSGPFMGQMVIRIYNTAGEVATEKKICKDREYFSEEMELSGFVSGVYIMELYSDQIIIRTRVLVF